MKITDSQQLLDLISLKAEAQKRLVAEKISDLQIAALQKFRFDGGWSICQCFAHLNTYYEFYLPQLEKAVQNSGQKTTQKNYRSGWLGAYFIKMMDPSTNKSKYKASKKHLPIGNDDPHETLDIFIKNTESFVKILADCRTVNLRTRVETSISPLLRLQLGDILEFLLAHNERHIQQALNMITENKGSWS